MVDFYTQEQNDQNKALRPTYLSGTAGNASTGSKASDKPGSSGQFTNLSAYLGANEGAGQSMANTVGGQIDKQANESGGQANFAASDFRKQVQQNTFGFTPDDASKVQNRQATPEQSANYEAWAQRAYTAPSSGSLDNAEKGLTKLDDKVHAYQGPGGYQTALTDTYGKQGQYTSGLSGLDSFLMGSDAGARGTMESAIGNAQAQSSLGHANISQARAMGEEAPGKHQAAIDAYNAAMADRAAESKPFIPGLSVPGQAPASTPAATPAAPPASTSPDSPVTPGSIAGTIFEGTPVVGGLADLLGINQQTGPGYVVGPSASAGPTDGIGVGMNAAPEKWVSPQNTSYFASSLSAVPNVDLSQLRKTKDPFGFNGTRPTTGGIQFPDLMKLLGY
jgi:hypothetical protein